MRSIVTDPVAWWSAGLLPVSPAKRLNRSRCRLGWGLAWAREPCVRWGPDPPHWKGQFWEKKSRRVYGLSAVSCARTAEPIDLPFGLWTPVDRRRRKLNHIRQVTPMCPQYHWTVHVRRRCGLLSNYFESLLKVRKKMLLKWSVRPRVSAFQWNCGQHTASIKVNFMSQVTHVSALNVTFEFSIRIRYFSVENFFQNVSKREGRQAQCASKINHR